MILDKNLRQLLTRANLSVSELSRKVDVPVTTLANWLNGQRPGDIRQLRKVAHYFRITIEELVFSTTPPLAVPPSGPIKIIEVDQSLGIFEVVLRPLPNQKNKQHKENSTNEVTE